MQKADSRNWITKHDFKLEFVCFSHIYTWPQSDLKHKIPQIFEEAVAIEFTLGERRSVDMFTEDVRRSTSQL